VHSIVPSEGVVDATLEAGPPVVVALDEETAEVPEEIGGLDAVVPAD